MRALYLVSAIAILAYGNANAQEVKIKDVISGKPIIGTLDKNDPLVKLDKTSFEIFRINAKAGQVISATLNSAEFRPIIEIGNIKDGGDCIDCNFSGADSENNAITKLSVEKTGPVYIRVSNNEAGQFGKFTLNVKATNAPIVTIPKLVMGKTLTSTLDGKEKPNKDGESLDTYSIKLNAGQEVQIDLETKAFDPFLSVTGPKIQGVEFYRDDEEGGIGDNARLVFKAPATGNYEVNVFSNDNFGEYKLKIDKPSIIAKVSDTTIAFDKTTNGAITKDTIDYALGDEISAIRYSFMAEAGKQYWISANSSDFEPLLEVGPLNARNEIEVSKRNENSISGNKALILFKAEKTQKYVFRISKSLIDIDASNNANKTTGNFEVNIKEALIAPNPENGKPIKIGDKITGSFKDGQPRSWDYYLQDFYEIELKKNQRIALELSPANEESAIKPMIAIGLDSIENYDLLYDGKSYGGDTGAKMHFKAPQDGKYIIRIQNQNMQTTGDYILNLKSLADNSMEIAPTKLEIGKEIVAQLDENDQSNSLNDTAFQMFEFDVVAGETYEITQKSDVFDSLLGLKEKNDTKDFEIFDEEIGSYYNVATTITPKTNGTYLIKASSLSGEEWGEFKIKVTKK